MASVSRCRGWQILPKVLNFFDIAGTWDPSLGFVMGGAVIVAFLGYRLVLRHEKPVFAPVFDIPTNRRIDAKLIGGSAVFGIGWGCRVLPRWGLARSGNA